MMNPNAASYKVLEAKWSPVLRKAGVSQDEAKRFLLQVYRMLVS